jgi:hypothetical protein
LLEAGADPNILDEVNVTFLCFCILLLWGSIFACPLVHLMAWL